MTARIKLTRFVSEDQTLPGSRRQAWPVTILAEGIDMDDEVFVYHIGVTTAPIPGDRFECVASVNQLYEIPRMAGVTSGNGDAVVYYRSNVLEYVARSAVEADAIWTQVVEDVQLLVQNWNASLNLMGVSTAEISETAVVQRNLTMNPPVRIPLSYHPAGTAGTDGSGAPTITASDPNQVGWLPVSLLVGGTIVIPPGAKFYYNLSTDGGLSAHWPPKEPYSGNQLFRNGLLMPYGVVWVLTKDTVWWMDFDPATIPGYSRVGGQDDDWGAPWPEDYVNRADPGAVPNMLVLTLYK